MAANPYAQGWREWDERYANLAIGRRNWQIAGRGSAPGWQVGVAMVTLMLSVCAAIALCSRIYRVGILMYGKKPALAEIVRWLRYG